MSGDYLSLNQLIEKLEQMKKDEDFNNQPVFVSDSNGSDYNIFNVSIKDGCILID